MTDKKNWLFVYTLLTSSEFLNEVYALFPGEHYNNVAMVGEDLLGICLRQEGITIEDASWVDNATVQFIGTIYEQQSTWRNDVGRTAYYALTAALGRLMQQQLATSPHVKQFILLEKQAYTFMSDINTLDPSTADTYVKQWHRDTVAET